MKQENLNMFSLGETLKELRLKNNYTLEEVAQKLGVTHKAVQFWEQGRTEIKLTRLVELAKLYGTTINDVFEKSGFR